MKITTVGDQFNELESKFKEALENGGYSEYEQNILRDAIDSVQYVRGFFSGEYVLPKLEESVHTTWGKTFMWIRGSFGNIEKAEAIVNSPKNENVLQMMNGQCHSTDEENVTHSLSDNEDTTGVDFDNEYERYDEYIYFATMDDCMDDFGSSDAEDEEDGYSADECSDDDYSEDDYYYAY